MHLQNKIALLEQLGFPASLLDEQRPVLRDESSRYHSKDYCSISTGRSEDVTLSLREVTTAHACVCLVHVVGNADEFWHLAESLARIMDGVADPVVAQNTMSLVDRYWALEKSREWLQDDADYRVVTSLPTLPEPVNRVFEAIREARDGVQEQLRSPQVRNLFTRNLQASGERLILGAVVAQGLSRRKRSTGLDALLLSYGEYRGNAILLDIPDQHVDPVYRWLDDFRRAGEDVREYVHVVTPRDTPDVIETATALWDPSSTSEMSSLSSAFEAAHRLCSALV